MSAPTGNTNATQWTREKTHHVLDQIETLALDEFCICHTLTQALLKLRHYKQLWSYLKRKWEMDGDVMDRIYYIEQIFICKLEDGALFRQMHPAACYFILRHNYGYNTRGETELPSHLRVEFEQPQPQEVQAPATTRQQTSAADTTTAKAKSQKHEALPFPDPSLDERFGLDVRKHPDLYSPERSPALTR